MDVIPRTTRKNNSNTHPHIYATQTTNNGYSCSPSEESDMDDDDLSRGGGGGHSIHRLHEDNEHMNQYERIGDRNSGTSTGSSALSHHQLTGAPKATHYAESAIYKRSRGEHYI